MKLLYSNFALAWLTDKDVFNSHAFFFFVKLKRVFGLFGVVLSQLSQSLLKSFLLLLFNLKVLVFSLQCVLFKLVAFDVVVVQLLQVFAQLLWVSAEKVESAGQLINSVREHFLWFVSMQHASKVYPRTQRLPHIILELVATALFFSGWKGVRSNQEYGILVAFVELLVQTIAHWGTYTLKK